MQQLVHIKHIVEDSFQRIEQRYENRDTLSGIPSGFYDLDALTSGFQPSDLLIVAARPSMGKCLSFDSEIVMSDGSIETIESICQTQNGKLLTLQDDFKLSVTKPSVYVDDGLKPVFRVTTRLGRSVETTITHPFLTLSGWKPLAEIVIGSKIAIPRVIPIFGQKQMRECEIKLLAYFIGDGCLSNNKASFTNTNPIIQRDFIEALDQYGGVSSNNLQLTVNAKYISPRQLSTVSGSNTASVSFWQQEQPMLSQERFKQICKSLELTSNGIPAVIFKLEKSLLALFLNRLFGTVNGELRLASGDPQVSYTSVNEKLIRQIQHLLLRFGIITKLSPRKVGYSKGIKQCFQLDITDSQSIETFISEIGIYGKELEIARAKRAAKFRTNQVNCNFTNSPIAESNIYWDEIIAIEPMGQKQVYDLTIPETHNFVANDICVHNTALCLNIAQHVAIEKKVPVAIFSLEMSKEQLVQRMLCSEAQIDSNRLRTGHLHTTDWTHLAMAMGRLGEAPIYIDDSALLNVLELRAKARRLKAESKGLGLIIIDYIQLLQGRKQTDNRVQEVSDISRSLKTLAREINVPVIALSQLSRAVESRQNKRPMLSDLRESGSLEQDADVVMFIYRDEYYNPEVKDGAKPILLLPNNVMALRALWSFFINRALHRFLNKVHNQYNSV